MAKITKKEYETRKAALHTQIDELENVLNSIPLEIEGLTQNEIDKNGEKWNNTYDSIEDLKKELYFLDQEWDRRNWNVQEHYMNDLMTNNID